MAQLVALYKHPADPKAFDDYYTSTHAPLAKTLDGLRKYEISTGPVAGPDGDSPYRLVALLEFDSLKAALGSPHWQKVAGDLANFAQAGVDLLMFDTKPA